MFLLPLTIDAWIEFVVIVGSLYYLTTYHAHKNKTDSGYPINAYIILFSISYYGNYELLIYIMPYTIPLFFMYIFFLNIEPITQRDTPFPHKKTMSDPCEWPAQCIKTILNHPTAHESITIVIEYSSDIHQYLEASIKINTAWNADLFTSILYDPLIHEKCIWMTNHGVIVGWHAVWHIPQAIPPGYKSSDLYLFYTKLTDVLICQINPKNRTCILTHQGIIQNRKTISETVQYISTISQNLYGKESYAFKQKTDNLPNKTA